MPNFFFFSFPPIQLLLCIFQVKYVEIFDKYCSMYSNKFVVITVLIHVNHACSMASEFSSFLCTYLFCSSLWEILFLFYYEWPDLRHAIIHLPSMEIAHWTILIFSIHDSTMEIVLNVGKWEYMTIWEVHIFFMALHLFFPPFQRHVKL